MITNDTFIYKARTHAPHKLNSFTPSELITAHCTPASPSRPRRRCRRCRRRRCRTARTRACAVTLWPTADCSHAHATRFHPKPPQPTIHIVVQCLCPPGRMVRYIFGDIIRCHCNLYTLTLPLHRRSSHTCTRAHLKYVVNFMLILFLRPR